SRWSTNWTTTCARYAINIWATRPRSRRHWLPWPIKARPPRNSMRRVFGSVVLALWAGMACAAEPTLAQKQAEARKQQSELRARIQALQKEIDSQESSRQDAANALKESESAISSTNRRLAELAERRDRVELELKKLAAQIAKQKQQL